MCIVGYFEQPFVPYTLVTTMEFFHFSSRFLVIMPQHLFCISDIYFMFCVTLETTSEAQVVMEAADAC